MATRARRRRPAPQGQPISDSINRLAAMRAPTAPSRLKEQQQPMSRPASAVGKWNQPLAPVQEAKAKELVSFTPAPTHFAQTFKKTVPNKGKLGARTRYSKTEFSTHDKAKSEVVDALPVVEDAPFAASLSAQTQPPTVSSGALVTTKSAATDLKDNTGNTGDGAPDLAQLSLQDQSLSDINQGSNTPRALRVFTWFVLPKELRNRKSFPKQSSASMCEMKPSPMLR